MRKEDRTEGGLNDWDIARDNYMPRIPGMKKFLDCIGNRRNTQILHGARTCAAASLLIPGTHRIHRAAANGFLAATSMATYPRHSYGTDGSDQVSYIVQIAALTARIGQHNHRIVDAALWYVALQSTMSYAVSGYVKMVSPVWRSGAALPGILRTETYGDQQLYKLISNHPELSKTLAHTVLLMECGFPAVFLAKGKLAPAILAAAGSFHVVNARAMGLGRFLTAFVATYPAVLYAAQQRRLPAGAAR
ncbi:hypothetical protein [Streptomyces sp. OspMP-M43]|uniref:hypothetical protein n=1 Tax=Streptomyces sp. OspMP-M43 TaxID=1839781 RepID=UPI00081B6740|nr:hypothetical protein [Streptomyces sp. OspMP-M43]SCE22992.1 hypothetical protein GA0115261_1038413 [Streptomyces sp. OspMP-M43]